MYKCNTCKSQDTIRTNGDAGVCTECGAIEDYEYQHQNEDSNERSR